MSLKQNEQKLDLEKVKEAASEYNHSEDIAKALGIRHNQLRYLLYTKIKKNDGGYKKSVRDAFYDGRGIYKKNRI